MKAVRDHGNPMHERLIMWLFYAIDRADVGSPSLGAIGLRPTLRWVWSGASVHAHRVTETPGNAFVRGFNEAMARADAEAKKRAGKE
jgi:hypothetical protein